MDLPNLYARLIHWIGDGTGIPDAYLHVHAGLAILCLARALSGRSLGSFIPLSVVAIAEFANEILDRLHYGSWRWTDTLGDITNTLFWPTVICIAVRIHPMKKTNNSE
jgi:hypothetical protein